MTDTDINSGSPGNPDRNADKLDGAGGNEEEEALNMDGQSTSSISFAKLRENVNKVKEAALKEKEAGKAPPKKVIAAKTAAEVSLELKMRDALSRAAKAEENYKILWELFTFVYSSWTNTEISKAGEEITNIIMYGDDFEEHLKAQKINLEALLYNLRRYIRNKSRTAAMREKAQAKK
jgi:hypothetical protein